MNVRVISAAVSAAIIGSAMPAMAASILIDDFVTNQDTWDLPDEDDGTPGVHSEIAAGEAIGGYRELAVQTDGRLGLKDEADTTLVVRDGALTFNNDDLVTGRAWVTYDGQDASTDPNVVNSTGLNANLLLGPTDATGFLFEVLSADAQISIEIRAWDRLGDNTGPDAVFAEILPAGGGNPFVPFAAFSGTIDWSQIGALQFFAQSGPCGPSTPAAQCVNGLAGSLDGSIGRISVEVIPLPAPALLLLGGLGGLGALRFRKRKA
jgi:hypothetical protein